MLERERWQQVAFWEVTAMATGLFNHNKPETVQSVIGSLREEITRHAFHTLYDRKMYVQRLKQELSGIYSEKRRLARLDEMTVG